MEIMHNLIDTVICGKVILQKAAWEISFICNFCEKNLSTLPELLRHALSKHVEDATADKLAKLCGVEIVQEDHVESNDCDTIIQEIIDEQEQEEMDEELLRHFMNKTPKNDNKRQINKKPTTPIEIGDDDNDVGDADGIQSNAIFEFLDIDNSEAEPRASLPKRKCKLPLLQCENCNAKFHHKKQLRLHKKKVHGERPFICNECGQCFGERRCLVDHELRHKGIKPHACTMCERTFTTHTEVTMHLRRHTGERPYKCSHCDKVFISSGALGIHMRTHTKERPHLCPICGMKFSSSSMLKTHTTTHSAERPHKCSRCSASFKNRGGLRQHMHLHSEVKKYQCRFCEKTFAQQAGVHSHMKSSHKNEHKIVNK